MPLWFVSRVPLVYPFIAASRGLPTPPSRYLVSLVLCWVIGMRGCVDLRVSQFLSPRKKGPVCCGWSPAGKCRWNCARARPPVPPAPLRNYELAKLVRVASFGFYLLLLDFWCPCCPPGPAQCNPPRMPCITPPVKWVDSCVQLRSSVPSNCPFIRRRESASESASRLLVLGQSCWRHL